MVQIVRAGPDSASELTAIAFSAKASRGYPENWLRIWKDSLTISPAFIQQNETWLAREGEVVAGFFALVQTRGLTRLEHLWVRPEKMCQGIGRALLNHAVALARDLKSDGLTIEADPNAEQFYLRGGARTVGHVEAPVEGRLRRLPLMRLDLAGGERKELSPPSGGPS